MLAANIEIQDRLIMVKQELLDTLNLLKLVLEKYM